MSPNISSNSNHASSIPGVESGPVDAPNNEAPAQAGPLAEINQRRGAGTEPEESSQCGGANAAPPKTNEVTSSADEQSAAGLLVEGHAAQKTESISAGEEPVVLTAEKLPTASKVVIIESTAKLSRRASMIHATLVVAEQNKAKVAATNGKPWSIGQAHIDSPKSSKYGISLAAGLAVFGIERLNRGELVQIEIGHGDTCYQLTGRASRKAAAYYSKSDLAQAGVQVHTPFHYVVLHVVPAGQNPFNVEGQL